jgi:hypothetical protein
MPLPNSDDFLFTASVENTKNAIDDGPSLGSFTGLLNSSAFPGKKPTVARITFGDKAFDGKVESVSLWKKISETEMEDLRLRQGNDSSELLLISVIL